MRHCFFAFILIFVCPQLKAQDIHFTQWWNAPLTVNPGLNGHQQGHLQINAGMRSQWRGVSGVPYQTQWLQGQIKQWTKSKWSWGGGLGRDMAGDGNWRQLQGMINGARHWRLDSTQTTFSLGGQIQMQQWSWDANQWQWGSQWNGVYYDPSLPSQEYQLQQKTGAFSFNSGAVWSQGWGKQWVSLLGFSAYHGVSSAYDMNGTLQKIPARKGMSLQLKYRLNVQWNFQLFSIKQRQSMQNEWMNLVYAERVLDQREWSFLSYRLGGGFRNHDAAMLFVGGRMGQHQMGLSYDWNLSSFSQATEYRGGWELHYSWLLNPLPMPKRVSAPCPDYY